MRLWHNCFDIATEVPKPLLLLSTLLVLFAVLGYCRHCFENIDTKNDVPRFKYYSCDNTTRPHHFSCVFQVPTVLHLIHTSVPTSSPVSACPQRAAAGSHTPPPAPHLHIAAACDSGGGTPHIPPIGHLTPPGRRGEPVFSRLDKPFRRLERLASA